MSTAAFIAAFDKWRQQGDGIADDEGGFAAVQAARDAIVSGPEVDELIAALSGLVNAIGPMPARSRESIEAYKRAQTILAKVQP
jgi:hypothetical protein